MYGAKNYIQRASLFANNNLFPGRKKLATLMIYGTDLCDSGCKHCLIWAKRPVVHLPKKKIIEIMHSKCVTKNTVVGLEGGEFLLHPEAMEIMEWLYNNHPKFDLLSNCLKPQSTIDAVKKYPPQRLYLSLDGDKETYKYMRGKDGYESVLKVIEETKDLVPISTMFTLSPYNSFDDMKHVAEICKKYDIDMRVGIYSDMPLFDTVEKAHETEIGSVKDEKILTFKEVQKEKEDFILEKNAALFQRETENIEDPKHDEKKIAASSFKEQIPEIIKEFKENYDFLIFYDQWRKKKLKLNCYSILDSLVIWPNGDVPLCQNLDLKLGNIYKKSLDEIFNGKETQKTHHEYVHNCNQCWLNFHRKYDLVLYRNLEKFFPKVVINKMFGYYQWEEDSKTTYTGYMKKIEKELEKTSDKKEGGEVQKEVEETYV
ncbi:MAG: radical SAM protein [Bacteroidetes bacterium]|nr:radical SAM protein [Bacteroidota bacterium]